MPDQARTSRQTTLFTRFSKQDIQMTNNHIKTCLKTSIIREMQIETTMRYHPMPSKLLSEKQNNRHCQECGEIRTLVHCG
jgi:hypothetical protein